MERYTSCLASLSPCGKCDSKELVFFQLDLYTVWGSFIVNKSPYNTQKYFLPEFCIHKSFPVLTLLQLKSRWFCFLHGKKRERVREHLGMGLVLCSCLCWLSCCRALCPPLGQLQGELPSPLHEMSRRVGLKNWGFQAAWLLLREEKN